MADPRLTTRGSRLTPLRAVLFDWDDTLSHMEPHYLDVLGGVLSAHGIVAEPGRLIRAWAIATRDPSPGWIDHLPALLGVDGQTELIAALRQGIDERNRIKRRRLFSDVSGCLRYLKGLGLKVGVLSDNFEARLLVEEYDLASLLDAVITPLVSGAMKPDPATFRAALAVLGVNADECLYVGDAYDVDVLGARAAGLDCLLIDRWGIGQPVDCTTVGDLDGVLRYLAERRYADYTGSRSPARSTRTAS